MEHQYFVYFITNYNNTTAYIGVTNNLIHRIYEHKKKIIAGFTAKYNLNKLVYYEIFDNIIYAIEREKQLKAGSRKKKIDLINSFNPSWDDLYEILQ